MDLQQIDDDLLLADFGVSITAGAVSGIGILDQNSELILQGQVVAVDYALTCRSDLFGNLKYGDPISAGASSYKVIHEPLRFADGVFCVVPLEHLPVIGNTITTISGLTITTLAGVPLITL